MEEFIFDDEVDEVGAEVEAHCPRCKADTTHVVVSKYEDEIRRVQCNPCGDVHPFRKPRGIEPEDELELPAPKKKVKAKPTWDQVMAKWKKPPRPYAIGEYFNELEVVSHPKFGIGYITENLGDDKIEVTFQNDKRVLVHNRKNLNLPLPVSDSSPKIEKKRPKAPKSALAEPKRAKTTERPHPKAAVRPAIKKSKTASEAKKPTTRVKPAPPAKKPSRAAMPARHKANVSKKALPKKAKKR
jgi:hypothetical protein